MKLKLELQIDIFGFDNLIIPLKIGQHYSCYILQGANVLLQKGTQSTLIYCDNKNASIPNIPNALRMYIRYYIDFCSWNYGKGRRSTHQSQ